MSWSIVVNLLFFVNFTFIYATGIQNETSCLICCKCDSVGPSDLYTVSGQMVTLWCHPGSDKNITVDSLYFTKGDEHFEYNKTITEDRTTLNITFHIGNARDYSATYYCRGNGSSNDSNALTRNTIVGKQFIEVESSPRPVSNLECRIFRFLKKNDQMQCTWYFNEDNYYKNENDIDVELLASNGATHRCPYMVNKRKCLWNFSKHASFVPLNIGLWKVEVVVRNNRNNFTSDVVTLNFSSEDVTYIEPVTSPNVSYDTSKGCIKLTFQLSNIYDPVDLEVKVTVHDKVLVYKYNSSMSSSPSVCGLLPFVRYDVSIQARLLGYRLWGQPTFTQAYYEKKQIKKKQLESIWDKIKNSHYIIKANIKEN